MNNDLLSNEDIVIGKLGVYNQIPMGWVEWRKTLSKGSLIDSRHRSQNIGDEVMLGFAMLLKNKVVSSNN